MFVCSICGFEANVFVMAGHMAGVHKVRNNARAYAANSTCRACCTNFRTRPKLIKHLSNKSYYSTKCLNVLVMHCSPLPDEEVRKLDAADLPLIRKLKKMEDG